MDPSIDWSSIFFWVVVVVVVVLGWVLLGYPKWRVWAAHQQGLADLQRAKNEQQIQIAQAQSRLAAADFNKQAAIIDAQAVSCQISEIGAQLTAHDLYLKWQWVEMMRTHSADSIIYVPTEANLPILEAGRFRQR